MSFKLTNDVLYLEKTKKVVNELFDRLNTTYLDMSYEFGMVGLAYMLELLRENGFLKDYELNANLEVLDDIIIEYALTPIKSYEEIDFLHGRLGAAHYLLKRHSTNKKIGRDINKLFTNIAEVVEQDIYETEKVKSLETFDSNTHKTNCGLAHGHVSCIIIFSHYLKKFPEDDFVKSVLIKSVTCLLNFMNDENYDSSLATFPAIAVNKKEADYRVPLGWCYGDQTGSLGLYRASVILKDKSLEVLAKDIAIRTLSRNTLEKALSSSSDACFCHGASGLSYLHKKWYQLIGDIRFHSLHKEFLFEVIKKGNHKNGIGGYRKFLGKDEYENSIGLLDGIIGIGIVLIDSQIKEYTFEWDELFLLN